MKLILTLVVLGALSAPAAAQSFCTCDGTGSVLAFGRALPAFQNGKTADVRRGLDAFASAPRPRDASDPDDPAAAGGGSRGYNLMLRNY
jgi:hypothetical protein